MEQQCEHDLLGDLRDSRAKKPAICALLPDLHPLIPE